MAKELFLIVGLMTVAFSGYAHAGLFSSSEDSSKLTKEERINLMNKTNNFIKYSGVLSAVKMDYSFIDDPKFKELKNYSLEIKERPIGRENPFMPREERVIE